MNFSRSGCTAPVVSVARDFSTAAPPLHFQGMWKAVIARGSTGVASDAVAHVVPPSVDTSTFAMVPLPDQAMPATSYNPGPLKVRPCDGRVISDFTSIGYVNMRALPSACRSVYRDVSSFVIVAVGTTLRRR